MAAKKRKKKPASKRSTAKKASAKKKLTAKKKRKAARAGGKRRGKSSRSEYAGLPRISSALSEQSGDLQGLSRAERADSESVDELMEEGNAFEAGIVEGVEDAEARSERGVHTREVPEDDVPGEYLDRDE